MLTQEDLLKHTRETNAKADKVITGAILLMFVLGLAMAPVYDTWMVALPAGGAVLAAFFGTRWLLPDKSLYQYAGSAGFAIFMAQFIYQMHGMFEMHFFAFIGGALLIAYQNWKVQLPNLVVVVVHHALFAWLQYQGNEQIYFTQLEYMDLNTFLIHAALAGVIIGICTWWSYVFRQRSVKMLEDQKTLQRQLGHVQQNLDFASEISKGNLHVSFAASDENNLGKALQSMQKSLLDARENEQRKQYINTGLNMVLKTLQQNELSLAEQSDKVMGTIAQYLDLQIGAIYLADTEGGHTSGSRAEDRKLKLVACYALNRKKYLDSEVEAGEGMAGQVFLEQETTIIKDLPEGYYHINSGLGQVAPGCVALVPLVYSQQAIGVLEVASLKELEGKQIEFLEKVAENIAAGFISVYTNEKTKNLLKQARQQAAEMKAQEEEMRQNMEEMSATQEKLLGIQQELDFQKSAITSAVCQLELLADGRIATANQRFVQAAGLGTEPSGMPLHTLLLPGPADRFEQETWRRVVAGETVEICLDFKTADNTGLLLQFSFFPLKTRHGEIRKILALGYQAASAGARDNIS